MSAILLRTTPHGTQYLNWRFVWGELPAIEPYIIPDWHLPVVMRSVSNKQPATGLAFVPSKGVIDLDMLEVIEL